jgi:hypothetical protein
LSESIQNWNTPIRLIQHLANPEIYHFGSNLRIVLEDLDTNEKWQVEARNVIGFKFTKDFGMKRLANTFVITESTWISALQREPMLIPSQLDAVCHYLIETITGAIEVLTKEEPSISKVGIP